MKRRGRRGIETFNMSFLDVISCGFGAIILLLVISQAVEPMVLEGIRANLDGVVRERQDRVHEIRGETTVLDEALLAKQAELREAENALGQRLSAVAALSGQVKDSRQSQQAQEIIEGKLAAAQQRLSEEMQRLLGQDFRRKASDATIGGIPVDSEYVIFIIDTSGSMFNHAWKLMQRKVSEVLDIYPQVKGLQIMNDMGEYMFSGYRGKWIPDTPARRKAIRKRLSTWTPFSNSSPVEGITEAIRTYYAPDKKISLYVFGDEFSTGSIGSVLKRVNSINKRDASGRRRVRIHAVGFPVQFSREEALQITGIRFAALMRLLCSQNDGTFVGLNSFRR